MLQEILPFTAWGEVAFIAVQTMIMLVLVYVLDKPPATSRLIKFTAPVLIALAAVLSSSLVNYSMISSLFNLQTAVLIGSRVPQIVQNFKAGSTGQLSFTTTFLTLGGGMGRKQNR